MPIADNVMTFLVYSFLPCFPCYDSFLDHRLFVETNAAPSRRGYRHWRMYPTLYSNATSLLIYYQIVWSQILAHSGGNARGMFPPLVMYDPDLTNSVLLFLSSGVRSAQPLLCISAFIVYCSQTKHCVMLISLMIFSKVGRLMTTYLMQYSRNQASWV